MQQVHLRIYGRVHGVGFRFFVKQQARLLGLKGYVRNEKDHVEVVAQGQDFKIKEFINRCKRGPVLSNVERVDVSYEEPSELEDFEIRL
ncbi:MAG: acylphosphatase [Candidatus Woesearchaeota archaeon]